MKKYQDPCLKCRELEGQRSKKEKSLQRNRSKVEKVFFVIYEPRQEVNGEYRESMISFEYFSISHVAEF